MKTARPDEPTRRPRPARAVGLRAASGVLIALALATSGCGALLLVGGAGTSAIAFATGELRSTEKASLARLDAACAAAVDALGYEAIETEREAEQIRWRARTAAGDPVHIRLIAKKAEKTELRIRIGIFGDETKSRLVLEEIHQAL